MIDSALSVLPVDAGPQHVKLLLEWDDPDEFFCDTNDAFVEHESVSQLQVTFVLRIHFEFNSCDPSIWLKIDLIWCFVNLHRIKSKAIQRSHWNNVWSIIQRQKHWVLKTLGVVRIAKNICRLLKRLVCGRCPTSWWFILSDSDNSTPKVHNLPNSPPPYNFRWPILICRRIWRATHPMKKPTPMALWPKTIGVRGGSSNEKIWTMIWKTIAMICMRCAIIRYVCLLANRLFTLFCSFTLLSICTSTFNCVALFRF